MKPRKSLFTEDAVGVAGGASSGGFVLRADHARVYLQNFRQRQRPRRRKNWGTFRDVGTGLS
jgi:hypothetical protein